MRLSRASLGSKHQGAPEEEKRVNVVDIGKAESQNEKLTLTGYCSLSENLEPCEWTFSAPENKASKPLLRILF